jgi:hypothetical protein
MAANVITGAKAKIRIPGKGIVGYATGISITENTLNGRVESLGYIDSREIVPISRNVQVQCSMIRIFNQYNDTTNFRYNDAASGDGNTNTIDERNMINSSIVDQATNTLSARTTDVLNQPYFDLEIFDSSNATSADSAKAAIYTVKNCKIASQNIVVDRASLMGVQVVLDAEYLVRHSAGGNIPQI